MRAAAHDPPAAGRGRAPGNADAPRALRGHRQAAHGSPGSPYGCCALALTGHQTKLLAGWPGGDRLAIHGTPQPETIGKEISLGCMRAHRRDIRALMRTVPLGSPVTVRR